jgi:RNA polymerase sigma factor (TIGR02999 family)
MKATTHQVTHLLTDWRNGDQTALDRLLPLVYDELHRIAARYMRGERRRNTLQTTALVNEAYMRLADYKRMQWQDRAHFFAVAAQAMRRILIDFARARQNLKRGGDAERVSFDEGILATSTNGTDLLALNEALEQLAMMNARQARVVELRYFGGLNEEEVAHVLGIAPRTVRSDWRLARAWLYKTLTTGNGNDA